MLFWASAAILPGHAESDETHMPDRTMVDFPVFAGFIQDRTKDLKRFC
jgi:hypothetical protein